MTKGMKHFWAEAERAGTAQPEEGKTQGESHWCLEIPEGRVQRGQRQTLCSAAQCQDKKKWAQTSRREVPSECQEELLYCAYGGEPAQVAWRGCGVSILGDLQKPLGQSSLSDHAWAGGWTRWPPEVPASLNHSVILWECYCCPCLPVCLCWAACIHAFVRRWEPCRKVR